MKHRYRIVTDAYCGFEAQVKYWWCPFGWWQLGGINTWASIEKAEQFIRQHARRVVKIVEPT